MQQDESLVEKLVANVSKSAVKATRATKRQNEETGPAKAKAAKKLKTIARSAELENSVVERASMKYVLTIGL